jgi:N-sulfoglucosamine sulfohydrolase
VYFKVNTALFKLQLKHLGTSLPGPVAVSEKLHPGLSRFHQILIFIRLKVRIMKGIMVRTLLVLSLLVLLSCSEPLPKRPNILFMIADDWGWPHSPMYGDRVIKTPTFDRLAKEGILFENAYVSSPSCTPSRSAVLTGQYHWRLGEAANLWSTLDAGIPTYPLLLEQAGYFVGHWRKCWGPGDLTAGGYTDTDPGGPVYHGFKDFLDHRPDDQPFCFWLGA